MVVTIIDLHESCKDKNTLLEKLVEWGMVPAQGDYACPKCQNQLKLTECTKQSPDGWRWQCKAKVKKHPKWAAEYCGTQVSFRAGTFSANKSKLSIFEV